MDAFSFSGCDTCWGEGWRRVQNNSLPANLTPTLYLQICKKTRILILPVTTCFYILGKRLNLPRYQFPNLSSEAVGKDDLERVHLSVSRRGSTARCTGEAKVTSCLPGGHKCGLEREVVICRCRCAGNGGFLSLQGLVVSHCRRLWWEFQVPRPPGVSSAINSRQELLKKRRVVSKVGKEPLQWFSYQSSI